MTAISFYNSHLVPSNKYIAHPLEVTCSQQSRRQGAPSDLARTKPHYSLHYYYRTTTYMQEL